MTEAWSVETPSLVSPANNAVNQPVSLTLTWNAVAFADSYRVQVSSSQLFTPSGMLMDTLVGVSSGNQTQGFRLSGVLNKTKYYWRVLSRKGADTSAWSGAWNFTTIVAVPASPVLAVPVAGGTSQAINPTAISWGAVTDAVTYRIQIATDSMFVSLVVQDSALNTPSKQVSGLGYGARYFWRVNAKNAAGISPYSPARSFTTKLAPPNPVAPPTGAVNQPIRLMLRWSTVFGASSYQVQVSAVSAFTTFIVNETTNLTHNPGSELRQSSSQ